MALALFDLDNTLVDRTAAFGRAVPALVERYGLDLGTAAPFIVAADADGTAGWATWMAATIARFGIETNVDEMQEAFRPVYLAAYTLDPVVADGLRRVRHAGWRIGIVTNGPISQADKITGTGLDRLVDGWVVSGDIGVRKPDRRIFAEAADRCSGSLEGGWMVGDSATADMAGAHQAGLRSVWLHRGRTWGDVADAGQPEPDHRADSPVAAIDIVLGSGLARR